MAWEFPMLPMQYWRTLQIDRLFAFDVPMQIAIKVILDEEVCGALTDVSSAADLETDFCSRRHSVVREARFCSIERNVEIKEQFVAEADIGRVPEVLEQLEKTFPLVGTLRHAADSNNGPSLDQAAGQALLAQSVSTNTNACT